MIQTPFFLGSTKLPSNILCAPLAGCSDFPFRMMTSSYGPGLIYCEMTKMDALVRNDAGTFRMLDFAESMHPIGAQICGSKPELAAPCAKIIEDLGFDVLDLNCGCPVDKVTKDGSGSALLKNPEKIGDILANMVAAVKIPVTVKIRIGWDATEIIATKITEIAEQAGAKAICIHGRTRAQGYTGPAKWGPIFDAKCVAKQIKVIANGDIFDPLSAARAFAETKADALLLARGTMGQPWLAHDIRCYLETGVLPKRTSEDFRHALSLHIEHLLAYQHEQKALCDLRRITPWYLRGCVGAKHVRESVNHAATLTEALEHIRLFTWEEVLT